MSSAALEFSRLLSTRARLTSWLGTAAIALFAASPTLAQSQPTNPDVTRIVATAIAGVLDRDTYGRITDRGIVEVDLQLAGISVPTLDIGAGRALVSVRREDVFHCPTGERVRGCSLLGTDYLVTVRKVETQPLRAEVEIELQGEYPSGRQPVWSSGYRVILENVDGNWRADVVPLWQT